jgi:hypothetical protein
MLPLTVAAAPTEPLDKSWPAPFGLAPDIADAVADATGVRLQTDAAAPDPRENAAFAAVFASARTEQVILELSARTNLVLAGTSATVIGDGALGDRLVRSLVRIGARTTRATDDPLVALRSRLDALEVVGLDDLEPAHYIFLTGEGVPPVDAARLSGVVVDASPDVRALTVGETRALTRPDVHGEAGARIVRIDPPLPADLGTARGLQWRILDALLALSVLASRGEPDALARLVLEQHV